MKYIVYWSFWLYHSVPCPCQSQYDSIYGVGRYSCAIAHGKLNKVDTSVFYYNRESAESFYKQMMIKYWKQEVNVIDGQTGKEYCAFLFKGIENIKIDSIKFQSSK